MSTSNLHCTEAQEYSYSQPIAIQCIFICSYAVLAYLFIFCDLYKRWSRPDTLFDRLTKLRLSVFSYEISFFRSSYTSFCSRLE